MSDETKLMCKQMYVCMLYLRYCSCMDQKLVTKYADIILLKITWGVVF